MSRVKACSKVRLRHFHEDRIATRSAACFAACLLLLLETATPGAACDGSTVAFEDQFATLDPSWATPYGMKADGGHLVLAVPADASTSDVNWANHTLSQSNIYNDVTLCATFTAATSSDPNQSENGLAFWGTDDNAFYVFFTSPTGSFTVQRKVAAGRWLTPMPWKDTPAVKKGFG